MRPRLPHKFVHNCRRKTTMVLGLLVLTSIPSVTGISQAISAQRNRDQQQIDERRMKKFRINIRCVRQDEHSTEIDNGRLVLKDGQAYVGPTGAVEQGTYGFVAELFYIEYPDSERVPVAMGLVSQVQNDPPMLNWMYVDKQTLQLRHGNRSTSINHHIGSWDWSQDERCVSLEQAGGPQKEEFVAVRNGSDQKWQLFFDMEGDALRDVAQPDWVKIPDSRRIHRFYSRPKISKFPPSPKGWSTERRGEISIGAFDTDEKFNLPEPYLPLLALEISTTMLIQCDGPGAPDSPKSCLVLYDDLSEAASQIVLPTSRSGSE